MHTEHMHQVVEVKICWTSYDDINVEKTLGSIIQLFKVSHAPGIYGEYRTHMYEDELSYL